jgi:hypothetical protein
VTNLKLRVRVRRDVALANDECTGDAKKSAAQNFSKLNADALCFAFARVCLLPMKTMLVRCDAFRLVGAEPAL